MVICVHLSWMAQVMLNIFSNKVIFNLAAYIVVQTHCSYALNRPQDSINRTSISTGKKQTIPVYQLHLSENRRGKSNLQKLFSDFFYSHECNYVTMLTFYCWLECGHHPSHFSETCGNLELNTLPVFTSITLVFIGQVKTVPSSIQVRKCGFKIKSPNLEKYASK